MIGNRDSSWMTLALCCLIGCVGFSIATVVVLSLIPFYLEYRAVARSSRAVAPYAIKNSSATATATGKRQVRSTLLTPIPTTATIQSFQDNLNTILSPIGASCVITKLAMPSPNVLSGDFEMFFQQPLVSSSAEIEALKNAFASEKMLNVNLQYYTDCNLSPVNKGPTAMKFKLNPEVFDNMVQSKPVPVTSLVQQADRCLLNPKCDQIFTDQVSSNITSTNTSTNSSGYKYYCFYWTPPSTLNQVNVSFNFQNAAKQVYLDDVSFNTTSNLIQDGGFETISASGAWNCTGNCSDNMVQENPNFGAYSFRAPVSNMPLQQIVTIPDNDKTKTFQIGFWLNLICTQSNPCSVAFAIQELQVVTTIMANTTVVTTVQSTTTIAA